MSAPKTVTVAVKSPFVSKTLIVAVITVIIGALSLPEISQIVPAEWLPLLIMGIGALNFILRFLTSQPIVNPPPEAPLSE